MKVQVRHDASGQIRAVGLPLQSSEVQTRPQTQEGEHLSEVEVPLDVADLQGEQGMERLQELARRYRIEGRGGEARVVEREQGA